MGRKRSIWRHRDGRWKSPSYVAITAAALIFAVTAVALVIATPKGPAAADPASSYTPQTEYSFDRPDPVVLTVLGDSYTGGSDMGGVDSAGWPAIVGDHFGWVVALNARGGSGFLQVGPSENAQPFSARLSEVVATKPDVLIVAGGINDAESYTAAQIAEAATAQLAELKSALPDTRIDLPAS